MAQNRGENQEPEEEMTLGVWQLSIYVPTKQQFMLTFIKKICRILQPLQIRALRYQRDKRTVEKKYLALKPACPAVLLFLYKDLVF